MSDDMKRDLVKFALGAAFIFIGAAVVHLVVFLVVSFVAWDFTFITPLWHRWIYFGGVVYSVVSLVPYDG